MINYIYEASIIDKYFLNSIDTYFCLDYQRILVCLDHAGDIVLV